MPWISPPSRFLGARERPALDLFPGEFRAARGSAAAAQGRDREFLRGLGPRVYLPPTAVGGIGSPCKARPSDYFRKFFNDSMVNGSAAAMRCGLEFFGAERFMYGTDFPMGSNNGEDWPVEVLDTIRSLGLSAADQELLLGANLHRIMRL